MASITCINCRTINSDEFKYCFRCGAPLQRRTLDEQEQRALRAQMAALQSQLLQVSQHLGRIQARLDELESTGAEDAAPAREPDDGTAPVADELPPTAEPTIAAASPPLTPPAPPLEPAGAARPPSATEPARTLESAGQRLGPSSARAVREGEPAAYARPTFTRRPPPNPFDFLERIDWEQVLGRNWLAIIGAVTLVLGIGFFLKLSFDNNWIGDTGRVVLGATAGLALLATGELARGRVPRWSQAVTAGGAATLYLTIFAAYALYELIPPEAAFLLLGAVVAVAGLLALRYNAMVIGILGIVGAFIAPVLLGEDLPDPRLALPYILIVDLGILWISVLRKWRVFLFLSWIGSYGVFAMGMARFPDQEAVFLQAGLTGIFLIFAAATTLFHILWRAIPRQFDMGLVAANASAYFLLSLSILEDHSEWYGLLTFGLALFYGLIALGAARRPGAPPQLGFIALPVALVFLTIAFPLQFDGALVSLSWGAQGATLVWAGFALRRPSTRYFGLGTLALAVLSLIGVQYSPLALLSLLGVGIRSIPPDFVPILNRQFVSMAFVAVAVAVAAFLYWRRQSEVEEWEWFMPWALSIGANVLVIGTLSYEAFNIFRDLDHNHGMASHEAGNGLLLSYTAIWATYGTGLLGVALWRGMGLARLAGMGLAGFAIGKLLLFDTLELSFRLEQFTPFLNVQFLTYLVVLLPLGAVLYLCRRQRAALAETPWWYFVPLTASMNVAAVWGLSVEGVHFFQSQASHLAGTLSSASVTNGVLLSLTLIWATYGTGMVAFGLWRDAALAHVGGAGLLAVTTLKLLIIDSFAVSMASETFMPVLNPLFLTYLAVLMPLAGVLYLYRRRRAALTGGESWHLLALMALMNLAALWGLSVETVHYFEAQAVAQGGGLSDRAVHSGTHMTLTVVWTLYAAALLAIGSWRLSPPTQWAGVALGAVALGKLLLYDTFNVHLNPNSYLLLVNTQFLTFALMLGLLVTIALQLHRQRLSLPAFGVDPVIAVLAMANLVAIWALTQEVVDFFDFREARFLAEGQRTLAMAQESAKHLSLTVLWALYAIGAMAAGMARQSSRVRLAGMALLTVPLVKLFGYDVFLLDQVYRVVAFVTLGVLLLMMGLAYQRYSDRVRGFLFGGPEAGA